MKITNQIRARIERKASKETFANEWANHKANEHKLFEQVYHLTHSDTVIAQVKALPQAWRWYHNHLSVECLYANGKTEMFNLRHDEQFLMPPPVNWNKQFIHKIAVVGMAEKIKAHFAEYHEIWQRSMAYGLQLKSLLADIHTDKKLRQAWPDGARFYNEFIVSIDEETKLPDFGKIEEMKPKEKPVLKLVKGT